MAEPSNRPQRTKVRSRGGDEEETILTDPCENPATAEPWIDIKRNKRIPLERGRGSAYQRTIYNYVPPPASENVTRKYEDPLEIKNPEDESQVIEYKKNVKSIHIESGRGRFYVLSRVRYSNGEENKSRKVRVKTVTNSDTGDHVDVERIDRYTVEYGRGFHYQAKAVYPKTQDEDLDDECPA